MSILYANTYIRHYRADEDETTFPEEACETGSHTHRIYLAFFKKYMKGCPSFYKFPVYEVNVPVEITTARYYSRNDILKAVTYLECPLDRVVRCV